MNVTYWNTWHLTSQVKVGGADAEKAVHASIIRNVPLFDVQKFVDLDEDEFSSVPAPSGDVVLAANSGIFIGKGEHLWPGLCRPMSMVDR